MNILIVDDNKDHQVLIDRLEIIETQRNKLQDQLERLIDLYLNDNFPKSALLERRTQLETSIADLHKEHTDISTHLKTVIITEEQIEEIEKVFKKIQMGINKATFDAKRRILELLDLRGKLAVKNGIKEVYIKCLIGQQQLSLVQTSP